MIGDGGFVFELEKRGYVKAGPWTPEACVEHPDAVKALHREFLRAGSDVMQTFTFYASDDKLSNRGNQAGTNFTVSRHWSGQHTCGSNAMTGMSVRYKTVATDNMIAVWF